MEVPELLIAFVLAGILGAAYATAIGGRTWVDALVGLTIGAAIAAMEVIRLGQLGAEFLRRLRLLPVLVITTCFWALLIIGTLYGTRSVFGHPWGATPEDHPHNTFLLDIAFAFAVGFMVSFITRLQSLFGTRKLFFYLIGRYARPVMEARTVLILDPADSTALAERLGALKQNALVPSKCRN